MCLKQMWWNKSVDNIKKKFVASFHSISSSASGLKGKGEKPRLSKKQNVDKPSHNSLVDI